MINLLKNFIAKVKARSTADRVIVEIKFGTIDTLKIELKKDTALKIRDLIDEAINTSKVG